MFSSRLNTIEQARLHTTPFHQPSHRVLSSLSPRIVCSPAQRQIGTSDDHRPGSTSHRGGNHDNSRPGVPCLHRCSMIIQGPKSSLLDVQQSIVNPHVIRVIRQLSSTDSQHRKWHRILLQNSNTMRSSARDRVSRLHNEYKRRLIQGMSCSFKTAEKARSH